MIGKNLLISFSILSAGESAFPQFHAPPFRQNGSTGEISDKTAIIDRMMGGHYNSSQLVTILNKTEEPMIGLGKQVYV